MDTLGLHGSTVLPSIVQIGPRSVQMREIVLRALVDSGLEPAGWNELSPLERDFSIVAAVHAMRAEAEIVYDA